MSQKSIPLDATTSTPSMSFPSVKRNDSDVLARSYTFHSVDPVELAASEDKGKARETVIEGEWMLGVDEAGRGPVLARRDASECLRQAGSLWALTLSFAGAAGPQVYGIAFCRVEYSEELRSHGFADSKTLRDFDREQLLEVIINDAKNVHYACTVMSAHDISRGMLRRTPYNLNAQSHDVTINLIKDVIDRGYNITQAFIDTVGIAADYQRKLEHLFPSVSFVVTSKADVIYPIVSAASIVAKVTRDHFLEAWPVLSSASVQVNEDGEEEVRNVFGSGYPSGEPWTLASVLRVRQGLESVDTHILGVVVLARTVKTILDKKAAKVKWVDEPATIQKYFSADAETDAPGQKQYGAWKDFGLSSVSAF
ncbi:BQ2448_1786 [Microbotryum intermedium]|uniref:Ribonuclease n=1 Tax=Microbotryum intermedium TaxID=269621 RepID=A0A238F942_9BASI|nr:BQ2448_1786 [Microbotryum intermedium]